MASISINHWSNNWFSHMMGDKINFFAEEGMFLCVYKEEVSRYHLPEIPITRKGSIPINQNLMIKSSISGFRAKTKNSWSILVSADSKPEHQRPTVGLAVLNSRALDIPGGAIFSSIILGRIFRLTKDRGIYFERKRPSSEPSTLSTRIREAVLQVT